MRKSGIFFRIKAKLFLSREEGMDPADIMLAVNDGSSPPVYWPIALDRKELRGLHRAIAKVLDTKP